MNKHILLKLAKNWGPQNKENDEAFCWKCCKHHRLRFIIRGCMRQSFMMQHAIWPDIAMFLLDYQFVMP